MHFSKISRKKRKLLLLPVRAKPKAQTRSMSFWRPPVHNGTGIEHLWFESTVRGHSAACGCGDPVRHLSRLAERYGYPGPSRASGTPPSLEGPPNNPPQIRRALPAPAAPEPPQADQWRGAGGRDDAGAGGGDAGPVAEFADDGLDGLLAALEDEE